MPTCDLFNHLENYVHSSIVPGVGQRPHIGMCVRPDSGVVSMGQRNTS